MKIPLSGGHNDHWGILMLAVAVSVATLAYCSPRYDERSPESPLNGRVWAPDVDAATSATPMPPKTPRVHKYRVG